MASTAPPRPQPFPDPRLQPLLDVAEAAPLVGLSLPQAYRAVASGFLPSIRRGSRIAIPTAELARKLGLAP